MKEKSLVTMQSQDRKKRLCIVPVCHGERFDLVHKFPSNNTRAESWRNILDIPLLHTLTLDQIRKRYFVCSRHFKISDYKNIESRGLNKTAEPSKNLKELNYYDTIDQNVPKRERINFVGESLPTEIITGDDLTTRLMLDSIVEKTEKPLNLRKRKNQPVKAYAPKRGNKNPVHDEVDDDFLSVLTPTKNFKDVGQMMIRIREPKHQFVLPITESQGDDDKNDIVVIDEPQYLNYDEAATPVELETIPVDDEEEEVNFVEIDEQEKQLIEENNDMDEMFIQADNNKEDEELDDSETLDIVHPDYPEPIKFHHFWLRDHCRCALCYSSETFQRKFNIMDIPIDIKVRECNISGKDMEIEWTDDHKSLYDLDFLCRSKFENHRKRLIDSDVDLTVLWDKNIINDADYARVDFSDYLANGDISKSVVRSLVKYGVAFIEKVPPNVQSTEIAIRNLFPIHRTFFGEMFTVLTDFKEFQDSAYSKEYLPAHTDNTYFPEASGLQILHVTQHNGTGGETLLVDGFKAATELKRKFPEAFERLLYTNVPAEYIEEGQNHYDCSPLLKRNTITGELEQIRFNLYDRAPLHSIPHDNIMQYYKDFRLLANEIQSPQNEWWFKLNPGTVMIFNNWRVLHGRAQYTGKRSLAGSYVSRTDFMSKVRSLGILEN